jgi:spore germination protein GerM
MSHTRTTIGLLLVGAMLIGAALGCGAKSKSDEKAVATDNQAVVSAGQSEPQVDASKQKQTIHVYLTDEDLTVLVDQSREIEYDTDQEKISAALEALQSQGEGNAVSLWSKVEVLSSAIKDGAVTINLHLPEGSRLGAPGEVMAIESLKKTLFQFDDVQSIELLVDGEAVDSLMGHEELPHPIVK